MRIKTSTSYAKKDLDALIEALDEKHERAVYLARRTESTPIRQSKKGNSREYEYSDGSVLSVIISCGMKDEPKRPKKTVYGPPGKGVS